MSWSTLPMPLTPNRETSTSSMAGVKKAGSVGPICMFLKRKLSRASNTMTAFCSYQAILKAVSYKNLTLPKKRIARVFVEGEK